MKILLMNFIIILIPIYESDLPAAKAEIVTDNEIISGNTIIPKGSLYNGTHTITVGTTTTFTYSIAEDTREIFL